MALPRLLYVLRSSNLYQHNLLDEYDAVLKSALERILNVSFSDCQWQQARLPLKHGGLGVRGAKDVALPAFISSCAQNKDLAREIAGEDDLELAGESDAIAHWRQTCLTAPSESSSQKDWDLPLIVRAKDQLLNTAVDERERARLSAAMVEGSGVWLQALPSPSLGLMLNATELRIAVALRLGCQTVHPHPCHHCGEQVDCFGVHGLSCRHSAGRMPRHKMANDVIRRALASAEIPSSLEPAGLARRDGRRPDGLTLVPWRDGRCMVWDFTCTDTFCATNVRGSARQPGSAAAAAEARKLTHYQDLSRNYCVIPVAIETTGVAGPATAAFIKDMSKRLISSTGDPKAGVYFRERLSIAVQRGNAMSVSGTLETPSLLLNDGVD